jgi:hypothetical protein
MIRQNLRMPLQERGCGSLGFRLGQRDQIAIQIEEVMIQPTGYAPRLLMFECVMFGPAEAVCVVPCGKSLVAVRILERINQHHRVVERR